jgi:hypothetical protein
MPPRTRPTSKAEPPFLPPAELADRASRPAGPSTPADDERLFNELNLLRLEGYYFCFDRRSATEKMGKRTLHEQVRTPQGSVTQPITIVANPLYGYPSVTAYKLYQAILKKISDYGRPVPDTVSFYKRELARLFGFKSFGGFQWKKLYTAIQQLRNTDIECTLYDKETEQWMRLNLRLVNTTLMSGTKNDVSQLSLQLDPFIVKSLNSFHSLCLNYNRLESLEPISIALYKHIFYHFSNLYSRQKTRDFSYNKDYADICNQWLGGLKVLRYKSKILQDQLGPHIKALKECGLVWRFDIGKNSSGDGFTLVFHPGRTFFEDYERFYGKQLPLKFRKAVDENGTQRPLELVHYFYRKLYQASDLSEAMFSDKETELASSVLAKHTFEEACWFVDFGLQEAKANSFDIRTFLGLKPYHPAFLARLEQLSKKRELEHKARKEAAKRQLEERYRKFCDDRLFQLREEIPAKELEKMEEQIREEIKSKQPGAIGINIMVRVQINALLTEKHGLPSFEIWAKSAQPEPGVSP